jgi:hypothetical protein
MLLCLSDSELFGGVKKIPLKLLQHSAHRKSATKRLVMTVVHGLHGDIEYDS